MSQHTCSKVCTAFSAPQLNRGPVITRSARGSHKPPCHAVAKQPDRHLLTCRYRATGRSAKRQRLSGMNHALSDMHGRTGRARTDRFKRQFCALMAAPKMWLGAHLTAENVRCTRPADGLMQKHMNGVLGAHAGVGIDHGEPAVWRPISEQGDG